MGVRPEVVGRKVRFLTRWVTSCMLNSAQYQKMDAAAVDMATWGTQLMELGGMLPDMALFWMTQKAKRKPMVVSDMRAELTAAAHFQTSGHRLTIAQACMMRHASKSTLTSSDMVFAAALT